MANFAPLKRHRFDCLDRFVEEQHLEPPFLDVGCGAGDVAGHLARRGWRGTAIDASPAAITRARERFAPYPGVDVRLVHLDELEGVWPTVLMWDVLEHLDDDRAALARVARLMAPGGRLLLAVPAIRASGAGTTTSTATSAATRSTTCAPGWRKPGSSR